MTNDKFQSAAILGNTVVIIATRSVYLLKFNGNGLLISETMQRPESFFDTDDKLDGSGIPTLDWTQCELCHPDDFSQIGHRCALHIYETALAEQED